MNIDKKVMVFKNDVSSNDKMEKRYVKFLDDEKKYAIFYMPLVAPSNFKSYIKENEIYEAYLIKDHDALKKYQDNIYTFVSDNGAYEVNHGLIKEENYVLLVDYGMQINLNLPKYSYEIKDDFIYLSKYKNNKNGFCYVANDDVNDNLKRIMIKTESFIPGVLYINPLSLESDKKKSLKRK
ncbi:MAG TPA: hypothetical protein IAB68_04520 [Candidatus Aphodocola excrementigallinarum]|uniref:Uncharacterized protein n=1 Tax=Candidatus Aphodocola excrementigallinarum TaxID=2840670 RepID=A0A9D1IRC2_9FIRM|nr:hypothetical protein [Candidatus Aphodocola excrementigallinarum]